MKTFKHALRPILARLDPHAKGYYDMIRNQDTWPAKVYRTFESERRAWVTENILHKASLNRARLWNKFMFWVYGEVF